MSKGILAGVILAVFLIGGIAEAGVGAASVVPQPECRPVSGAVASEACVEGDVTQLAAQLLVVKFGSGATAFAQERALRYQAGDDPGSAAFWRGIAEAASALLKSR
jgi:hypothetical protein